MTLLICALLTALLMGCHYLSPYLKRIPRLSYHRISSFASGVAVGYVFLHMLPEIVESRDRIHEMLNNVTNMSPFKDLIVYAVALLGFEVFYILERICSANKENHKLETYRLDLGKYFIYNFLITYTLFIRVETGIGYALLFTIAMGLHFILTDNYFSRYYHTLFRRRAHLFLLLGLFLGFIFSALFPVNIILSAFLTAFLSGAVLYNAFAEEISLERKTSMAFFFLGTAVMALLLAFLLIK